MRCTSEQIDALKEMISIGVGKGANVLGTMLDSHIRLGVPSLKLLSPDEFGEEIKEYGDESLSSVNLPFRGNFSGIAELIFPSESASRFIAVFTREEGEDTDIDSIRAGTLSEVGNIVLNAVMGTISNLLGSKLTYSIPSYSEGSFDTLLPLHTMMPDATVLLARTHFDVGNLEIEGNIILFFEVGSFDKLLSAIDTKTEEIKL